eukprot:2118249-Lingulodinium_polyedra.AAC.1
MLFSHCMPGYFGCTPTMVRSASRMSESSRGWVRCRAVLKIMSNRRHLDRTFFTSPLSFSLFSLRRMAASLIVVAG